MELEVGRLNALLEMKGGDKGGRSTPNTAASD